jgi:hypothetical protein
MIYNGVFHERVKQPQEDESNLLVLLHFLLSLTSSSTQYPITISMRRRLDHKKAFAAFNDLWP